MRIINNLASWWERNRYAKISYRGASRTLKRYYQIQIQKSITKVDKDARFRYSRMIDRLWKHAQFNNAAKVHVLCLGARNMYEINALRQAGFGNVVGIDLFSAHSDILIMDMHDLSFPDDSFDLIFSGDSFEHAHTPKQVAAEITRVLKPGGYVCLSTPIQWRRAIGREYEELSKIADCQDFSSKEEVYAYFPDRAFGVTYDEMYTLGSSGGNLLAIMQKTPFIGAQAQHAEHPNDSASGSDNSKKGSF